MREFGPVAADGLFNELLCSGEGRYRHHHLHDTGHVLAIVLPQQRELPRHEFREPPLGNLAGHDANRLPLLGQGDSFLENPIEVGILLVQVDVEMKTEHSSGPSSS